MLLQRQKVIVLFFFMVFKGYSLDSLINDCDIEWRIILDAKNHVIIPEKNMLLFLGILNIGGDTLRIYTSKTIGKEMFETSLWKKIKDIRHNSNYYIRYVDNLKITFIERNTQKRFTIKTPFPLVSSILGPRQYVETLVSFPAPKLKGCYNIIIQMVEQKNIPSVNAEVPEKYKTIDFFHRADTLFGVNISDNKENNCR